MKILNVYLLTFTSTKYDKKTFHPLLKIIIRNVIIMFIRITIELLEQHCVSE